LQNDPAGPTRIAPAARHFKKAMPAQRGLGPLGIVFAKQPCRADAHRACGASLQESDACAAGAWPSRDRFCKTTLPGRRASRLRRAALEWEAGHRPKRGSLWLLPSGPDQVGEAPARANLSRIT